MISRTATNLVDANAGSVNEHKNGVFEISK